MTDFERQLQGQTFCEFARHWRDEEAETAGYAAETNSTNEPFAFRNSPWPSPVAWLSLAAVWMLLLGIDRADRPVMTQSQSMVLPATGKNATFFAFQTRADIDVLLANR